MELETEEMDFLRERVIHGARVLDRFEPGWRERVPLHQLYPLLVHLNLFGASYVNPLRSAIDRYL